MRPIRRARSEGRSREARRARLEVLAGLAGFVVGVYVVVVVGGGLLIGRTDSPSLALSVVATAVVALGFERVQTWLETAAGRRVHGGTPSPYDVLSRFSETVTGGYATEEVPGRMAMLLAQGTGAQWAQVWLFVQDEPTLVATWPSTADADATPPEPQPGARDATGECRRALSVRQGGHVFGMFRLQEHPDQPLTAVEERLFTGLAAQAGLVLRLVGLRAELAARHHDLQVRADELQASRERLIEAQDTERRRLERDIHDGAQQHLVALAVNLRLAETVAARSPERAAAVLAEQAGAAREAIETLSRLSRGIYPRLLSDEGLVPALRAAVSTSPVPVTIEADGIDRLPDKVEAALYFVAMEAVQNAAKHSGGATTRVRLRGDAQGWELTVEDDGAGFDPGTLGSGGGSGLVNMRDRLDAVGGTVTVVSSPGAGTTVTALVPASEPALVGASGVPKFPGSAGRPEVRAARLVWVAWLLLVVSVVCAVLDTWITAVDHTLMSEAAWARHGWPFAPLATIGCSLMGALVVSRYPRHPIGWLLCVSGLASISTVTEAYALWGLHGGGPGTETAWHWAGWISLLFGAPLPITAVILVFLVAPDGRLLSSRWRWAARAAVAGLVFYTAGVLTISPGNFDVGDQDEDYGLLTNLLTSVGILLLASSLVAAAVSVALRLRSAQGEARRQLLWIVASATFLASAFIWILTAQIFLGPEQTLVVALPLFAAYLAFPICTAVAVLRYRLFDIDLIVNRALVVALATGLVAIGYVALVVGLGSALGDGGPGGFWFSLLATAVVAMAFQPLRKWVVRVADRLAFGASAAPYEALADFSRRLGESPDPSRLLSAVADAAGSAVGASRASVRLPVPGGPDQVATWPSDAPTASDAEITVSVTDRGETLGTLCVDMPPGRALREQDSELLQDLADQSGLAFRNARLSAELAQQVEQLDRRTHELASSTRRLITAGDAERSRLERALARQVAPHLEPLPDRLSELSRNAGPLRPQQVQPLVAAATSALEALREITRGVYPAQLTRSGLEPALGSLLGRDGIGRLVVESRDSSGRPDPRVEAAAYFCVAEVTRDVDPPIEVLLTTTADDVRLVISGGEGGELVLSAVRDRVEAAGGTVDARCAPGETVLEVVLPTGTGQPVAPAQTASSRSGPNADLVT